MATGIIQVGTAGAAGSPVTGQGGSGEVGGAGGDPGTAGAPPASDPDGGVAGGGGIASLPDAGSETGSGSPTDAGAAGATGAGGAAGTGAAGAPPPVVYEAENGRLIGDAERVTCTGCSGGRRVTLGEDSMVTISNVEAAEGGTKVLLVRYTNGDSKDRSLYVGVNGHPSQTFWGTFKPTGGWDKVASVALRLSNFRAGSNNSVTFFIDTELDPPSLDRLEVQPAAP